MKSYLGSRKANSNKSGIRFLIALGGGFVVALAVAAGPGEKPEFKNPGGMWLPPQMKDHAKTLKRLGLEYDPLALTDPLSFPLGAVVSLGGCSASFVSPEGLVVTNHHCIQGALQFNTTATENLIENGYLAKSLDEEKWAGPSARVLVTTAFRDVTEKVLEGIEQIEGDEARYKEIQKRRSALVKECEKQADTRCMVGSFFEGAQFFQIEQLELRDVRLVYSPHQGVGFFGGFDDNWRWPRHCGDYGFLRAYVGKDGKPADYSVDNVPFRPKHYLKLASRPLSAGDLVMVAGYPGATYRFRTAAEVADDVSYELPRKISLTKGLRERLEALGKEIPATFEKTHSLRFSLQNSQQNFEGSLGGLQKSALADKKAELEARIAKWIASSPEHEAKYGNVFEKMAEKRAEYLKHRNRDQALVELVDRNARPEISLSRGMNLLKAAYVIVRKSKEREKPDAERPADFQERNWARLAQDQASFQKEYHVAIDRESLRFFLNRVGGLPEAERPALLGWVVGDLGAGSVEKALDALYDDTSLEIDDLDTRKRLLDQSYAEVSQSSDPFIRLAVRLLPEIEAMEKRNADYQGGMAALRPKYVGALMAFQGGLFAPDANGTLRISYGTVRGYRPAPEAPVYVPFTTPAEMVAKHTGVAPFNAPEALVAAVKAALPTQAFGPYKSKELGTLPVDFLADLDITGGNSGSATLNSRGELVGLAFDGNWEAMSSDWVFQSEVQRSIHVDMRYALWIMDAVDGADSLLREMGVEPALP